MSFSVLQVAAQVEFESNDGLNVQLDIRVQDALGKADIAAGKILSDILEFVETQAQPVIEVVEETDPYTGRGDSDYDDEFAVPCDICGLVHQS